MESQEQLQLERLENKRVNKYLDDIVQEVEAKAPILKRQRDEHERMQKSVASLSAKLEQAVKVCNFDQLPALKWNYIYMHDRLIWIVLGFFLFFSFNLLRRCTAYKRRLMKQASVPLFWKERTRGVNCSWETWLSR